MCNHSSRHGLGSFPASCGVLGQPLGKFLTEGPDDYGFFSKHRSVGFGLVPVGIKSPVLVPWFDEKNHQRLHFERGFDRTPTFGEWGKWIGFQSLCYGSLDYGQCEFHRCAAEGGKIWTGVDSLDLRDSCIVLDMRVSVTYVDG